MTIKTFPKHLQTETDGLTVALHSLRHASEPIRAKGDIEWPIWA